MGAGSERTMVAVCDELVDNTDDVSTYYYSHCFVLFGWKSFVCGIVNTSCVIWQAK